MWIVVEIWNVGVIRASEVIRDAKKNWIFGFALKKGSGSVLEAKLWRMFEGLKLAWDAGLRKVFIDSNSMSIVYILNKEISLNHHLFNIVNNCKMLVRGGWCCTIGHVYRENNKVVNSLTSLGHYLGVGIRQLCFVIKTKL
ncbi:hypothetical protein ACOSQ3_003169 [Xanthoceras sorbifolium]